MSEQKEDETVNLKETKVSTQYFFEGNIMKARLDQVRLPNGKPAEREVCEHVGGVGVLPIDADGNIILVRQFRYPYNEVMLEIPAGKMDHDAEQAQECGARELREETGYIAGEMISLGVVYPSPGFLTETVHLYAARLLQFDAVCLDEDEFVETILMPIAELEEKIVNNEVRDAKTIVAMYRAKLKLLF